MDLHGFIIGRETRRALVNAGLAVKVAFFVYENGTMTRLVAAEQAISLAWYMELFYTAG